MCCKVANSIRWPKESERETCVSNVYKERTGWRRICGQSVCGHKRLVTRSSWSRVAVLFFWRILPPKTTNSESPKWKQMRIKRKQKEEEDKEEGKEDLLSEAKNRWRWKQGEGERVGVVKSRISRKRVSTRRMMRRRRCKKWETSTCGVVRIGRIEALDRKRTKIKAENKVEVVKRRKMCLGLYEEEDEEDDDDEWQAAVVAVLMADWMAKVGVVRTSGGEPKRGRARVSERETRWER